MRKTEIVKKDEQVTIVTCDICGNDAKGRMCTGIKQCWVCGCDVCYDCSVIGDFFCCDLLTPSFMGDYPDYICKSCWEKGEEIRHKIMEVRNASEEKEGKLLVEWKRLCIVERNKNQT